jgi:xylulokinase
LGVSILVPKDGDFGPALGSARLARIATTGEDISMVMTTATVAEIIEPDVHLADAFDEAYRNFVKSYGGYRGLTK